MGVKLNELLEAHFLASLNKTKGKSCLRIHNKIILLRWSS